MMYPADTYPHLSKSIHSIGLDQRITTEPTFGNKRLIANQKYFASEGLQGLGTDSGGYDYNALVQSETLSWFAQPTNKYLMLGGVTLLVLWYSMSKGHRR